MTSGRSGGRGGSRQWATWDSYDFLSCNVVEKQFPAPNEYKSGKFVLCVERAHTVQIECAGQMCVCLFVLAAMNSAHTAAELRYWTLERKTHRALRSGSMESHQTCRKHISHMSRRGPIESNVWYVRRNLFTFANHIVRATMQIDTFRAADEWDAFVCTKCCYSNLFRLIRLSYRQRLLVAKKTQTQFH